MMDYKVNIMIKDREVKFFKQLNGSERTRQNYARAIRSTFIKGILYEYCGTKNLFDLDDLNKLWDIYSIINLHPKNINNHRNYSAAIMKYIRFLNDGQKYGKRTDFGRSRAESGTRNKGNKF